MEDLTAIKLSNKKKIGYALGAIPNGLLVYVFELKYIEYFFNDLKLLPLYFIVGQIIYLIINAFNDPLLGYFSDKTNREKWGSRRLIYIKYGGPIWALTFILVWFPWSFDNQIIIFFHFVITVCLFDMFFTLVVTVWLALLPEMTSDINERGKVQFLVLLFGLSAVLPAFLIVGDMKPISTTFKIIAIFIAILSTIIQLVVVKTTEERPEFQKDEAFSLGKSIKECFKLKSFRLYIGFIFFTTLIESVLFSYLFAYLFVLGDNGLIIFFSLYVIGVYSSYIVCLKLQPKWGIRTIILRFGILKIIGTTLIFGLWYITSLEILILLGLAWLMFFSGYTIFIFPLLHLSIDEDEVIHKIRREGMFFGIQALFNKPAVSIGPIIATVLLISYGYIQGSEVQPESTLFGIMLLLFIYPIIMTALSLFFIYLYPLHGTKLKDMKDKLEEIHKMKLKNYQR